MRKLSPFLRNSLSVFAIGISSLWPTGDTEARENSRHQLCRGEQAPESMIKRYLWAMENHSASAIQELFTTDGTVISTSVGNANAAIFYEKFLPQIKSAKTQLGEIYKSTTDDHHYSASFIFRFTLEDGTSEGGAYVDEFYFEPKTCKFQKVIMYENMKYDQ